MDVATLVSKLESLRASVQALIAKGVPPAVDLQPVADAIDAIQADINTANTPAA